MRFKDDKKDCKGHQALLLPPDQNPHIFLLSPSPPTSHTCSLETLKREKSDRLMRMYRVQRMGLPLNFLRAWEGGRRGRDSFQTMLYRHSYPIPVSAARDRGVESKPPIPPTLPHITHTPHLPAATSDTAPRGRGAAPKPPAAPEPASGSRGGAPAPSLGPSRASRGWPGWLHRGGRD